MIQCPYQDFAFRGPRALLPPKIGILSTDVREPRTATGSRMFLFLAWFCFLPLTGKILVDDCGLMLQTLWCENAPKKETFNFRLPSVAQKCLCLSSLILALQELRVVKVNHDLWKAHRKNPLAFSLFWQQCILENVVLLHWNSCLIFAI